MFSALSHPIDIRQAAHLQLKEGRKMLNNQDPSLKFFHQHMAPLTLDIYSKMIDQK